MYLQKAVSELDKNDYFVFEETLYRIYNVDNQNIYNVRLAFNIKSSSFIFLNSAQKVDIIVPSDSSTPDGYYDVPYHVKNGNLKPYNINMKRFKKKELKIRKSNVRFSSMVNNMDYMYSVHKYKDLEHGGKYVVWSKDITTLPELYYVKNQSDDIRAIRNPDIYVIVFDFE